jgi:hypothetical protein
MVGGLRDGLSAVASAATVAQMPSCAVVDGTVYRLAWQRRKGRSRLAYVAGDGGAGGWERVPDAVVEFLSLVDPELVEAPPWRS